MIMNPSKEWLIKIDNLNSGDHHRKLFTQKQNYFFGEAGCNDNMIIIYYPFNIHNFIAIKSQTYPIVDGTREIDYIEVLSKIR